MLAAASEKRLTRNKARRSPRPCSCPRSRSKHHPYALEIHSHVLQNVVADLDKAFEALLRRVKARRDPGYPQFKVRIDRSRVPASRSRRRLQGRPRRMLGRAVTYLSGIGQIAVRWHRTLRRCDQAARIFCRQASGRRLLLRGRAARTAAEDRESIGIDLRLMRLATFSNGEQKRTLGGITGTFSRSCTGLQRKIARCVLGDRDRRRLILRLQRLMVMWPTQERLPQRVRPRIDHAGSIGSCSKISGLPPSRASCCRPCPAVSP